MRRRSIVTELGTPRIRVSSLQIERVDTLEPGVPGRFGQLGADGGGHLCPQVICGRCAHGGGSPSCPQVCPHVWRSTGQGVASRPRSVGPTVRGSTEHRGRRATGVADHISAVDNATSASIRVRWQQRPRPCGTVGRASAGAGLSVGASFAPYTPTAVRRAVCDTCVAGAPRPRAPSRCGPGVRGGHA